MNEIQDILDKLEDLKAYYCIKELTPHLYEARARGQIIGKYVGIEKALELINDANGENR